MLVCFNVDWYMYQSILPLVSIQWHWCNFEEYVGIFNQINQLRSVFITKAKTSCEHILYGLCIPYWYGDSH